MNQRFDGPVQQVAAGHIINQCPGQEHCLLVQTEEARQVRFERETGITCSKGAREALQFLLDSGVFDRRQLSLGWHQGALVWDWDDVRLQARPSWPNTLFGIFVMLFGGGIFLLAMGMLVFVRGAEDVSIDTLQAIGVAFLYLFGVFFAQKYMVRPNSIARRARPMLQHYYSARTVTEDSSWAIIRTRVSRRPT